MGRGGDGVFSVRGDDRRAAGVRGGRGVGRGGSVAGVDKRVETLGIGEGQTVELKVPALPLTRYLIASVVAVVDTGNSLGPLRLPSRDATGGGEDRADDQTEEGAVLIGFRAELSGRSSPTTDVLPSTSFCYHRRGFFTFEVDQWTITPLTSSPPRSVGACRRSGGVEDEVREVSQNRKTRPHPHPGVSGGEGEWRSRLPDADPRRRGRTTRPDQSVGLPVFATSAARE